MEIKARNKVVKKKISELEIMKAYLIFNPDTFDSTILIPNTSDYAIHLGKYENDSKGVCITHMKKTEEVNVIGQISDFDIVNVNINQHYGEIPF